MDHFWQIRGVGPAEHEMLEAYSALGFIAAHTEHALLHTLVTGVIYREPGLLAKAVTTLNVLVRRASRARHRRGLERGRVPRPRLRLPAGGRALREA